VAWLNNNILLFSLQDVSQQLNNAVDIQSLQAAQVQLEKLQHNAVDRGKEAKSSHKEKTGGPQVSGHGDG
jgi:hypothetical protein